MAGTYGRQNCLTAGNTNGIHITVRDIAAPPVKNATSVIKILTLHLAVLNYTHI